MSTKIHQKCPWEFTQNMFMKIHPKRWILVDEICTRIDLFCPRKFTFYVHEKSATQENMRELRETQKPSLAHGMFSQCWSTREVCLMFENVFHVYLMWGIIRYAENWDTYYHDGFLSHLQKRTANPAYLALFFAQFWSAHLHTFAIPSSSQD